MRDNKGRFIKGHDVPQEWREAFSKFERTPEMRLKMRLNMLGQKRPQTSGDKHWDCKGEKNPFFGKSHKEDIRRKISISHKGKRNSPATEFKPRELSPNWKGGITVLNEEYRKSVKFIEWRKNVYKRDGYACQVCGKKGGRLNAHHISPFATDKAKRFDVDNGITLCIPCHSKIHMKERWNSVKKG